MPTTFKPGDNQPHKVAGKTIRGFRFNYYLQAALVNVALNGADLDRSKVIVECYLRRAGKDIPLFTGMAHLFHQISEYFSAPFEGNAAAATGVVLQAQAAGAKALVLFPHVIDLGGVINLADDDQLILNVNLQTSAYSTDIDTTNGTVLTVEDIECIGYETYTPKIKVHSIEAGKDSMNVTLGDDVTEITYVNTDKTGVLVADSPIVDVNVRSDKYAKRATLRDLLTSRVEKFQTMAAATARNHTHRIFADRSTPIDDVNVELNLTGANVVASKNFIVVRHAYTDGRLVRLVNARRAKHAAQFMEKKRMGLPSGVDSGRIASEVKRLKTFARR